MHNQQRLSSSAIVQLYKSDFILKNIGNYPTLPHLLYARQKCRSKECHKVGRPFKEVRPMDELQLRNAVSAARAGDKNAFEQLYRLTERQVYFTCLKLLANEQDAKDAMQDAYLNAMRKLDTLEDGAKFPQWICRIAVNRCREFFRKTTNDSLDEQLEQGTEFKDDESFIPEEYVTDEAKRKVIMDIITSELSDVQRQVIIMYYYDEMSLEEIAQVMQCPVKTVSSRLCSAREKIRNAVLAYENKHDDRLHMLIPAPILIEVFRRVSACSAVPDVSQAVLSQHVFNTAANAYAAQTTTAIAQGSTTAGGMIAAKITAVIAAGVIAAGGITTAGLLSSRGADQVPGSSEYSPFTANSFFASPGQIDTTHSGGDTNVSPWTDPSPGQTRTGDLGIQDLSSVMESIKGMPVAQAKQTLYENFGIPTDQWETEPSGSYIYHTAKIPGGIKIYQNTFDTIEIAESSGVVYNKGETVSIYKVYDSYTEAASAMAWLTGYLTNELKAGGGAFYTTWPTNSGKVSVSIDVGSGGMSGILTLGFEEK